MSLRLDHVGIVVRDLTAAMASYVGVLNLPGTARTRSVVVDPETGEDIDVGFLRIGDNRLEFICPRPGSTSRFADHLARHGEGMYHICVYVDEFHQALDQLRAGGVEIEPLTVVMTPPAAVGEPVGPATRVVDIAWVPTSMTCGVNLELVQANPPAPGSGS